MKRKYFSIILVIILILGASMAWGSSETTNLKLTKPGRGDRNWGQTINNNMDTIDSEIGTIRSKSDDLPEVYVYTGTFNSTTGTQITLPKSVDNVNEYAVKVTPTSRAGAIGDIYVSKTTSNFTIKCSEANTTDTFSASVYYIGDVSSYGSSLYRKWYVSPDAGITDHGDTSETGSLAWVQDQIGGIQAAVELVGNKTYQIRQNLTLAANLEFIRQKGAIIDTDISIRDGNYEWALSGSGTNEYYLQAAGGGDPSVHQPVVICENESEMTEGNAGSLSAGEWDWNDNDSLGYATIYVRLSDSSDPDTKSADYVEAGYQLTVNALFDPKLCQAFSGNGKVVFGSEALVEVFAEFWGIDGTADEIEINKALSSVSENDQIINVRLLARLYTIAGSILMNYDYCALKGSVGSSYSSGSTSGTLISLADGSDCHMVHLENSGSGIQGFLLANMVLNGNKSNQTSPVYGVYSPYQSNDGRLDNVRASECKGDGFNLYFNDVYSNNIESASNDGRGIYLKGNENHFSQGDIENNLGIALYLDGADENQFYGFKSERNYYSAVNAYFKNSSRNHLEFMTMAKPDNIYLDDDSHHNYIKCQPSYLTRIEIQDHGVKNEIDIPGTATNFSQNGIIGLISDVGTDMDMALNNYPDWTKAGTGDQRKATPVSQGLIEFDRSFLIRANDASYGLYQDLPNADLSAGDYFFHTFFATPISETDTLEITIVEDPSGTPNTLLSHDGLASFYQIPNSSDKPFGCKAKRHWGVVTVDGGLDIRLKFRPESTGDAVYSVVGETIFNPSIVTNGSLEAFTGSVPGGWSVNGTVTTGKETTSQYTGDGCLKLSSINGDINIEQDLSGSMNHGTRYLIGARFKPLTQAWIDAIYASNEQWPGNRPFHISLGNAATKGRYTVSMGNERFIAWSPAPLTPEWVSVWMIANPGSDTTRSLFIQIINGDEAGGGEEFLIDDIFCIPLE